MKLDLHNEAFRRLEGIPATVRVDNEKTAVGRGAGVWGDVFGDPVIATAILDRVLHNSHVLDIKGRSYRLRDLERLVTQPAQAGWVSPREEEAP